MAWRAGGENSPGLIPQLSQRLGILKKMSRFTSKKKLRMLSEGLFYSKLSYCLPLFMNTWGLDNYVEVAQTFSSITKEDCRKMQVLQNQVCRLLLDRKEQIRVSYHKQNLSTKDLMETTGNLSVHQLGAHRTLVMVKRVLLSTKPAYIAERLKMSPSQDTRSGSTIVPTPASLNLTRSSFLYRGIKLFNLLPEELRKMDEIISYKTETKQWIKNHIKIKP